MRYDPISLQLFASIERTGSISAAAEDVGMALSAASRRITRLEEDAGVPLLERLPRGVVFTPAGAELLIHAQRIGDAFSRLRTDMSDFSSGVRGSLRVWASSSSVILFLPEIIQTFLQKHPALRIDLQDRPSGEVLRAVREGESDLGLFVLNEAMVDAELFVRSYRKDQLVLLVNRQHRLAGQSSVWFSELLDEDFVTLLPGSAMQRLIAAQASRINGSLKVRMEVRSFEAMARMVAAGVGIGILPQGAMSQDSEGGNTHRITLLDDWACREHCLVHRDPALLSPAARLFAESLMSHGPSGVLA